MTPGRRNFGMGLTRVPRRRRPWRPSGLLLWIIGCTAFWAAVIAFVYGAIR